MALAGTGAVAIWHDIAPEGRAEFYAWHGSEHMPERAAIPGFRRGRRYVAVEGRPEYFNLYETASPAVLTSPEYFARLNAPTPWTRATVRHFRDVARGVCEVAASVGAGQGGLIATYRYDMPDAAAAAHRVRMGERLAVLAGEPGIAGAHLLVANADASAVETAERRARGTPTAVPRWIVLVEGWGDVDDFCEATRRFGGEAVFSDASIAPDRAVYRLQNTRAAEDR
jgi:hypothetical protein